MPRPLYPQGKRPWYPLDRRLGGPQGRSVRGGEKKDSQSPPGIEPYNSVQSVAQRYTDWAITARTNKIYWSPNIGNGTNRLKLKSRSQALVKIWEYLQPSSYLPTYLPPRTRFLIEILLVTQIVKNFPALFGIQRFITVVTRAHQFRCSV
jgi:hypothetical protein